MERSEGKGATRSPRPGMDWHVLLHSLESSPKMDGKTPGWYWGGSVKAQRIEDEIRLGEELGRGFSGVVLQGRLRENNQEVAVKIINKKRIKFMPMQTEMLMTEIEALERVRDEIGEHPALVRFYHVVEDDSRLAIVQEYLQGGELFDRLVQRGAYTEKDASQIMAGLLEGLKELHKSGIVHRDLKPENILLASHDDVGNSKISDFGIALLHNRRPSEPRVHKESNTSPSTRLRLVGTPGYIAPEVLQRREYGEPADIWSLGVIAYILLVGYPPFSANSVSELGRQVLKGELDFTDTVWDEISSDAKTFVGRMLEADPTQRATCDELLEHVWIKTDHSRKSPLAKSYEKLKQYQARKKFKAAAFACMISADFALRKAARAMLHREKSPFTIDVLLQLKAHFEKCAQDGKVSRRDYNEALHKSGIKGSVDRNLFDLYDSDGSGQIKFREFLLGVCEWDSGGERILRFCFDVVDEDSSGYLSREELGAVLTSGVAQAVQNQKSQEKSALILDREKYLRPMSPAKAAKNTAQELESLFAIMDENNDGQISYAEFKSALQKNRLLIDLLTKPRSRRNKSIEIPMSDTDDAKKPSKIQSEGPRSTKAQGEHTKRSNNGAEKNAPEAGSLDRTRGNDGAAPAPVAQLKAGTKEGVHHAPCSDLTDVVSKFRSVAPPTEAPTSVCRGSPRRARSSLERKTESENEIENETERDKDNLTEAKADRYEDDEAKEKEKPEPEEEISPVSEHKKKLETPHSVAEEENVHNKRRTLPRLNPNRRPSDHGLSVCESSSHDTSHHLSPEAGLNPSAFSHCSMRRPSLPSPTSAHMEKKRKLSHSAFERRAVERT